MSFLFKTPQEIERFVACGNRHFKGGGSGQREATAEERQLWATQAASIADQMDANAENRAVTMPVFTRSLADLEAMSNKDFRGEAGADASMGMGQGLAAATRGLERYGSVVNPNALAAQTQAAGLQGAALKAGAMNIADRQKFDRKAALFNGVQGMPMQTANAMGNAAAGLGGLANQIGMAGQRGAASNAQAMQGLGQMGAWLASGFKDGGPVRGLSRRAKRRAGKRERRLAMGGPASSPRAAALRAMQFSDVANEGPSTSDAMLALAGPMAVKAGAKVAMPFIKQGAKMAGDAISDGTAQIAGRLGLFRDATQAAAPVVDAAPTLVGDAAMHAGVTKGLEAGFEKTGEEIATKATEAVTEKAAEAGAEQAASMVPGAGQAVGMAANLAQGDYIGAALNAIPGGNYIDFVKDLVFADGGLARKNMMKGGKVRGPGTETSDSIPARLSDGEFVLNAKAVDLVGEPVLRKINNAGLKAREHNYAGGGFVRDLGLAASGFVPTMIGLERANEQRAERDAARAEDARRWDAQDARMTAHDKRIESADAKAADRLAKRAQTIGALQTFNQARNDLASGRTDFDTAFKAVAPAYNQHIADGHFLVSDGKGGYGVSQGSMAAAPSMSVPREQMQAHLMSPETALYAYDAAARQLLADGDHEGFAAVRQMAGDVIGRKEQERKARHDDTVAGLARDRLTQDWKIAGLADARQARRDAMDKKDRAEKEAAIAGIYRQLNPGATPEAIKAAQVGIVPVVPKKQNGDLDNLKATDGIKVLQSRYGGRFEGGMWFPDEKNRDVAVRAHTAFEKRIATGMTPMAAADAAIRDAEGAPPVPVAKDVSPRKFSVIRDNEG